MNKLKQWQQQHLITDYAMNELSEILGLNIAPLEFTGVPMQDQSETAVQIDCRLRASTLGGRLWRNNVGVAKRDDGTPVRYGLCNESKKMNQLVKSSDLIGIKPVIITASMVNTTIGQFWAPEIKKGDWSYTGTAREIAQMKFHKIVNDLGGDAKFVNNVRDL